MFKIDQQKLLSATAIFLLQLAKSLLITLLLSCDSVFLSCAFGMGKAVKRKWQNIYSPVIQESMLRMLPRICSFFFFPSEPLQKCFPMDLEYKHVEKRIVC